MDRFIKFLKSKIKDANIAFFVVLGLGIVATTLLIANIMYFIIALAAWLVIIFLFLAKASYDTWKDDELK